MIRPPTISLESIYKSKILKGNQTMKNLHRAVGMHVCAGRAAIAADMVNMRHPA